VTQDSSYNSVRDERLPRLQRWLDTLPIAVTALEPASADASTRRYFRLTSAGASFIVMDDPPATNSMDRFIDINHRLAHVGANVPEIFHHCETEGFMVLQDFGDCHYLQATRSSHTTEAAQQSIYQQALDMLITLQQRVDTTALPPYGHELLSTELGLFNTWYVERHLGMRLDARQADIFDAVAGLCIDTFDTQPKSFVHRDYHSRNLMLTDANLPGILDYQDAVIGPVTYDVVSLLKDCYIDWPAAFIDRFMCWHHDHVAADVPIERYRYWFDITGLQRHLKVLGIFTRLWYRDGKQQYLADLPVVLGHIRSVTTRYPELREFDAMLNELQPS
jgi:aminoglycoside/choline kinase family phosphotransferase